MSSNSPAETYPEPFGRRLPAWLRLAGVARSTYYSWSSDLRPTNVVINKRVYITESPQKFFARMSGLNRANAEQGTPRRRPVQVGAGAGDAVPA
jgi:hypothetical protein